ncbi:MAG: 7-carboxy-7-deazaguanine synthase [Candidatus Methylomirabilota bacterium]|nr:MAG: 7-carboxy-7-deazaguanine synthase [candidate division NC10 bacterium]
MSLFVNEIFYSIQGESTYAGRPCVFVRLTGCNLRCRWCDTTYAYHKGEQRSIEQILARVRTYKCPLVEITGGEPLLQEGVYPLVDRLVCEGFEVLVETGGSLSVERLDPRAVKILDLKAPGSGMDPHNNLENLRYLTRKDQIKFVVADRRDYEWARQVTAEHALPEKTQVLFSAVLGELHPRELAEWILADGLDARLQIQLHKYLWDPDRRGV